MKILFVGVAQQTARDGTREYTSTGDNLRRELFRLLNDRFAIPLKGLSLEKGNNLFHGEGYFFVHAGKARPVGMMHYCETPCCIAQDGIYEPRSRS